MNVTALRPVAAAPGAGTQLPCQRVPADWFFPELPEQVQRAKDLCATCPLAPACLELALDRAEPWGVWGGHLFQAGEVIANKRPRGRPRKDALAA